MRSETHEGCRGMPPRCPLCGGEIKDPEKEEFTYYRGDMVHLKCYLKHVLRTSRRPLATQDRSPREGDEEALEVGIS